METRLQQQRQTPCHVTKQTNVKLWLNGTGYTSVSVLSRHGRLLPLRIGYWRDGEAFRPDPLLCAVEPPMANVLELKKLRSYGHKVTYSASINRQCHTYAVTEHRDARSHALHRVFTRSPPPALRSSGDCSAL